MEEPSKESSITHLSNDHIFSILRLLPVDSILSFSITCKRFADLASSNSLWESICERDFGSACVQGLSVSFAKDGRFTLWKKIYEQVSHLGSVFCIRQLGKGNGIPRPRASHSLDFVSDSLVLFGGGCEGGRHLEETWLAHAEDGRRVSRWRQTNSGVPPGRFGQNSAVVGDMLVLFGGINDHGVRHNDTWIGQFQLQVEGSTSHRFVWTPLHPGHSSPSPRGAHAGCSVGSKWMIIHGGIGPDGHRLGDTWLLDFNHGLPTWREILSIVSPPARSGHTLTWIGGSMMILFGGRGAGYEVLDDMWVLDIGRDQSPEWIQVVIGSGSKRRMPQPRVGHSATLVLGGHVLIFGGEDSQRRRKNDFWILDPNVLPTVKCRSEGWRVSSTGRMWKKLQVQGHPPDPRSFHRACTDRSGRFVYIFGGMIDAMVLRGESAGFGFDGGLYLAELLLNS